MDVDHAGQTGFFLLPPVEVEVSSPGKLLNPVSAHKLALVHCHLCPFGMVVDHRLWTQTGQSIDAKALDAVNCLAGTVKKPADNLCRSCEIGNRVRLWFNSRIGIRLFDRWDG
jgi:hypothetical protein